MFRELDVGQSTLLTDLAMCINYYRLFSPGLYCCVHATVQLDDDTRFCPGIIVMVSHGQLKQCDPEPSYDCFKRPPNFVLDVFPGDDLLDYQYRRDCFERHRVIEYVAVLRLEENGSLVYNLFTGMSVEWADQPTCRPTMGCCETGKSHASRRPEIPAPADRASCRADGCFRVPPRLARLGEPPSPCDARGPGTARLPASGHASPRLSRRLAQGTRGPAAGGAVRAAPGQRRSIFGTSALVPKER
jgi:hypothetical protein